MGTTRVFGWGALAAALIVCRVAAASPIVVGEIHGVPVDAGSILVVASDGIPVSQIARSMVDAGLGEAIVSRIDGVRVRAVRYPVAPDAPVPVSHLVVDIPPGVSIDDALGRARGVPGVVSADPNYLRRPLWTPNDPGFAQYQDNFRQIYAEDAWEASRGAGVKVAVIDTGYLLSGLSDGVRHLADPSEWYDFADQDSDPTDEAGHGTHITNTIAEATHNATGVAGLAHNATILPLKIFPGGSNPQARESDLLDAVNWAVDRGAQVVSMSLGGSGSTEAGIETFARAAESAFLVCATGNDGEEVVDFPGAYVGCMAIGAVGIHEPGAEGVKSDFSNYGPEVFLVAPGEDVVQEAWTEDFGTAFFRAAGTSSAVPHVSSVAAMMIARAGASDLELIADVLADTAQDIGLDGWDAETGYGEVDAAAAVDAYAAEFGEPPVASIAFDVRAGMLAKFRGGATEGDAAIAEYRWDFGDGQGATGREVEHRYAVPGTYGVFLTVVDAAGMTDSEAEAVRVKLFGDGNGTNPFGCGFGESTDAGALIAAFLVLGIAIAARRRAASVFVRERSRPDRR